MYDPFQTLKQQNGHVRHSPRISVGTPQLDPNFCRHSSVLKARLCALRLNLKRLEHTPESPLYHNPQLVEQVLKLVGSDTDCGCGKDALVAAYAKTGFAEETNF
jgi:hypothetical protein